MACVNCSVLADRESLLQKRVSQVKQLISANITVEVTHSRQLSKPVIDSTSIVSSVDDAELSLW